MLDADSGFRIALRGARLPILGFLVAILAVIAVFVERPFLEGFSAQIGLLEIFA